MVFVFDDFVQWIPNEHDFTRMADYSDTYANMTYQRFVEWNRECLDSATNEQREFVRQICKNIMDGQISLMDLESCVEFTGYGVYFNPGKRICIFNQR